jgi:zinc transporter, ZIP family
MRQERGAREVVLIWTATAALLALAVVVGYAALEGVSDEALSWPLGFAAGAVLASLADTLMPEAFGEGGPPVAYATALGFLASFLISAA